MAVAVLVLVALLGWRTGLRRAERPPFRGGLAAWALARPWCHDMARRAVLGPLKGEQLISLAVRPSPRRRPAATLVIRRAGRPGVALPALS